MKEKKSNNYKKIDKSFILNEIKLHYKFKNDGEFAQFLGVGQQTISNWRSRNTFDLELIYTKCENINANWLLTGEGEMLQNFSENGHINSEKCFEKLTNYVEMLEKEVKRLKEEIEKLKMESPDGKCKGNLNVARGAGGLSSKKEVC